MKINEVLTVTEVSLVTATVAFVLLVIFLIVAITKIKIAIEAAQRDFHRVSLELSSFLSKTTDLSSDVQNKIDLIFDSVSSSQEAQVTTSEGQSPPKSKGPLKLIGWVISSLLLARKTKNFIKGLW